MGTEPADVGDWARAEPESPTLIATATTASRAEGAYGFPGARRQAQGGDRYSQVPMRISGRSAAGDDGLDGGVVFLVDRAHAHAAHMVVAVDEAASAASLERLTKLLGSCDAIKVELTATGVEAKAKARAASLQKLMEAKAKGKVAKATGAAGDGSTKVTVATPCP